MSRAHTLAQANRARAASVGHYLRLEVRNPDDTAWVDLGGFTVGAEWGRDGDQATIDGTIELLREEDPSLSLAPYMGSSLLNRTSLGAYAPLLKPKRRMRLLAGVGLPDGTGTDWRDVLPGVIDEVDSAQGDNVLVTVRDIGALLLDRQIEDEQSYGGASVSLEFVLQQMLNNNGFPHVTLYTPVSPNWNVTSAVFEDGSLLDAMRSLANQIGWDVRYEWDASDDFRLTLFKPNQEESAPVTATFGPGDYETIERFNESGADVRTVVRVHYTHATGRQDQVEVEAPPAVIAEYGRLFMAVPVESTFAVHTVADATALAGSVLADVSKPLADQEPLLFFWPYVQVGDVYEFLPNGVHYDTAQVMYTFGYRHEARDGHISTRLTVAGKPIAFHRTWRRRAQVPPTQPGTHPTIALRIVTSDAEQQTVEVTATHPTGHALRLETSVGGEPFVLEDEGPGPLQVNIQLPRSAQGEDHVLIARATALDSGFITEVPYTADWDYLPEVVSYSVRPLLDVNGDQVGHVVDAIVDDDANSVVVDKESGEFDITDDPLHNTSVVKTIANTILQDVGEEGVLRLRPFAGVGATGMEGKTTRVPLLRTPVSSITMRDLTVTRLEVTISANPAAAQIHYRSFVDGDAPPAWQAAPSPVAFEVSRHGSEDVILEYFAKVAGVAPEPRRRLVIDPDQSADIEIGSVVATGNRVTVSLDVEDEDIVRYHLYAKPGGWPTVDGTAGGALDELCLRAANSRNEAEVSMFATDGDWYFIAVGYDFANTPGVRGIEGPVEVDGTVPVELGYISNASVQMVGAAPNDHHYVTWGASPEVDLDYYVVVNERMQGGSYAPVSGNVPAPDRAFDAPRSFTQHYPNGDSGAFIKWDYRIDLYKTGHGYVHSINASISGYYLP